MAQTYQLEDEYQDMTAEQEAAEVQTLTPQAEYREMTKLHQGQAEMERKMMGLSHIVKERMKELWAYQLTWYKEVSGQRFQQSKNYIG